jgi:hypothetical protein
MSSRACRVRLAPLAPLALVGALAAGCEKQIDHARAEDLVRSSMRAQGIDLSLVACPDHVVAKPGVVFQCTGKDDEGSTGTFDVTVLPDETYSLQLRERYVDEEKFGGEIAKRIAAESKRVVEVHCPKRVVIVRVGVHFSCDLHEGGVSKKATFTYRDGEGAVDVKIE